MPKATSVAVWMSMEYRKRYIEGTTAIEFTAVNTSRSL